MIRTFCSCLVHDTSFRNHHKILSTARKSSHFVIPYTKHMFHSDFLHGSLLHCAFQFKATLRNLWCIPTFDDSSSHNTSQNMILSDGISRVSQQPLLAASFACFKTICFFCRDQCSKVRGAAFNLSRTRDTEVIIIGSKEVCCQRYATSCWPNWPNKQKGSSVELKNCRNRAAG